MITSYLGSVCGADKDRYVRKLRSLCGEVGSDISNVSRLDPYQIPPTLTSYRITLYSTIH